jgi:hypothetical protein
VAPSSVWRAVESYVSILVLGSLVLGALWVLFVFDEWEFLSFVFAADQPFVGPMLGLLVYGASTFILGVSLYSDGPSTVDVLALIFSIVVALACVVALLGRIVRLAIGVVW